MNDDTPDDRSDRKERVLHTRVPAVLEAELKRLADTWKVPVSNVVRAILEDAMEAVEVIGQKAEGELHGFADRLQRQRDALKARVVEPRPPTPRSAPAPRAEACPDEAPEALDGLLGFRRVVLAAEAACTGCGRRLPRGEAAWLGERDAPGPRVLLAAGCRFHPDNDVPPTHGGEP